MPLGEAQRKRLNENEAWFLLFTCQSIFGSIAYCSPVRGTLPSSLLVNAARSAAQAAAAVAAGTPMRAVNVARSAAVGEVNKACDCAALPMVATPGKLC